MDGLCVQLTRRKSGGGTGPGGSNSSGANFRTPTINRSNHLQVTLRRWIYRLEGAAIKQWKRRWFVLDDYCLFYYTDTSEEKLLGSVLLQSYKVSPYMSSEDGVTRKYVFKLEHQNMKTYHLAADSTVSMTQMDQLVELDFNYAT